MLGAGVFLWLINLIKGINLVSFSANAWLNFIGMGVICQLVGWLTINYAISRLPATKTTVALLSQTIVTAIIAAILLHEKLALKEIIGSVIVLFGIGITFIKRRATTD
jgi:drug/metabolite transporter (DMT)-like permease